MKILTPQEGRAIVALKPILIDWATKKFSYDGRWHDEALAYFDTAYLSTVFVSEASRLHYLNQHSTTPARQQRLELKSFGDFSLPLHTFESKDKGLISTLFLEYAYPALASVLYQFLDHYGMGKLVKEGRPEAVIPRLPEETALHHFKSFTRQSRCLNKCGHLEVIPNVFDIDDPRFEITVDTRPQLTACWQDNADYHARRDTNNPEAPSALHNLLNIDVFLAMQIARRRLMVILQGEDILAAVEYSVDFGKEVYWHNTFMRRTPHTAKIGLGNFAIYKLLEIAYTNYANLNLGLATFPYKEDFKPSIEYAYGIAL